ncbi:phage tail tube protein [Nocardioides kribbensis]|uniref:phage tail tube protein n=1 Tax=Nocardioides kribbensis TaxID=305517 RepID=UPI00187A1608|nr:hypothetical protein [Nocardioides kribbensis]
MAEPLRPNSVGTFGKTNWIFVTTLANKSAPSVAEVNATSGLDISRIIFASSGKPSQSTNRVTNERRLGDTKVYERIGVSNVTGGTMTYAFDPQAASGSDGKKWFEKIPEGASGFLIERKGIARATAPAAGQFVNVYPVEFGPSFPTDSGAEESAESAMTVEFSIPNEVAINVAIAA